MAEEPSSPFTERWKPWVRHVARLAEFLRGNPFESRGGGGVMSLEPKLVVDMELPQVCLAPAFKNDGIFVCQFMFFVR